MGIKMSENMQKLSIVISFCQFSSVQCAKIFHMTNLPVLQEYEQVSGRVKSPIPHIPEKDELQEAVETTALIKLTLPTKVELQLSVWACSTMEKFIMHIQQAIAAIKAKGL